MRWWARSWSNSRGAWRIGWRRLRCKFAGRRRPRAWRTASATGRASFNKKLSRVIAARLAVEVRSIGWTWRVSRLAAWASTCSIATTKPTSPPATVASRTSSSAASATSKPANPPTDQKHPVPWADLSSHVSTDVPPPRHRSAPLLKSLLNARFKGTPSSIVYILVLINRVFYLETIFFIFVFSRIIIDK